MMRIFAAGKELGDLPMEMFEPAALKLKKRKKSSQELNHSFPLDSDATYQFGVHKNKNVWTRDYRVPDEHQ